MLDLGPAAWLERVPFLGATFEDMTIVTASCNRVTGRGGAVDRVTSLDRSAARIARRAVARVAEALVGRAGLSRWPHPLVWRLRSFIHATPPAIDIFAGKPVSSPADLLPASQAVLLVSHDLSASGAPQLLVEIGRALRKAGVAVLLLSPSDGPTRAGLVESGVTVIVDPAIRHADAPVFARIAPCFDAALCNTVDTVAAVTALAPALPVIWYLHEVDVLRERIGTTVLREALGQARRLWAGSEMTAEILRPVRADVRIVPYGLEKIGNAPPPGQDDRLQGDRLRLAVFGSYESRKGQDLLVAAIGLLPPAARDRIAVSFYGRVLVPEYHAALVAQAALVEGVSLSGELDRASYIAAMLACDAVVVPSRADSLPLVSLDALGAALVLICTATTGTAHYLTPGHDGFVAAHADAPALAATLELAIARAGEWSIIGARGRDIFDRSFSQTAFADTILAEIAALAAQLPASGAVPA